MPQRLSPHAAWRQLTEKEVEIMSSPLRALRKYQRVMMVVFGCLLMVAFILGGVATRNMGGGRPTEESGATIAVSWDGHSYSPRGLAQDPSSA
ncbi:MAG: hypothetical protein R3B96_22740 [Pirellulaceae bacterium]